VEKSIRGLNLRVTPLLSIVMHVVGSVRTFKFGERKSENGPKLLSIDFLCEGCELAFSYQLSWQRFEIRRNRFDRHDGGEAPSLILL